MTRPGVRPGGRPLFCFAKKEAKKATPMIAPRCAGCPCRRCLKRGAAELATLRFAQTDAAPCPLQASTARRAQRGFHGHFKSNGNCRYADCNGNGNCRYADFNGNGNRFCRVQYPQGIDCTAFANRDGLIGRLPWFTIGGMSLRGIPPYDRTPHLFRFRHRRHGALNGI
jgi:hypothetical protein